MIDDAAIETIPAYIIENVKKCSALFAENERTARRFLKSIHKEIVIDDFEWYGIHKAEEEQLSAFRKKIKEGRIIGIISEAGCPGVADPGQVLIAAAQEMNAVVKPLVGPSSILLALMASGMNGQQFSFLGYLPIDAVERTRAIQSIEQKTGHTHIFIETPYRNNQMLESILKTCKGSTRLCIAADITSAREMIKTKTVSEWKQTKPELHKKQVIFLLHAP